MLGFDDLLSARTSGERDVACPVRGCTTRVPVQTRRFQAIDRYKCATHGLFISKSTFEYASPHHNLLWDSPADRVLLDGILQHKRESRLGRERSEDAVSWNVFRYLELSGLLDAWVASVTGQPESNSRVHYWSFDSQAGVTWGEPSGITVARLAKAFFWVTRSRNLSGIAVIIVLLRGSDHAYTMARSHRRRECASV